jgi:hypothetical protein
VGARLAARSALSAYFVEVQRENIIDKIERPADKQNAGKEYSQNNYPPPKW